MENKAIAGEFVHNALQGIYRDSNDDIWGALLQA